MRATRVKETFWVEGGIALVTRKAGIQKTRVKSQALLRLATAKALCEHGEAT